METANTLTFDGVLQLAGEFENASPERQQQIRGTLGQWRQADRLRQEQELAAQQESVDRFFLGQFTNDQEFQQSADHPSVHLAESHSDDPGQVKYTALGQSYLSSLLERDVSGFEYQYQRDGYSLARFGRKPANDSEFRDMVAGELRTKQAQKTAWEDLQKTVIVNAVNDSLAGKETMLAPTFQEWAVRHRDLIDGKEETAFLTGAFRQYRASLEEVKRLREPAGRTLSVLTAYSDGAATDEDVFTLGQTLASLPDEDRRKVLGYVGLAADARGIKRDVFEQLAKNIGESISRGFDWISKGNLASQEDWAAMWLDSLKTGNVHVHGDESFPRLGADDLPGNRPLTPQESAEWTGKFEKLMPAFQVTRELRALAKEKVDPIKPLLAEGTWGGEAERGLYGLAGSAGTMVITAIPGVGMIAGSMVLADEEYDRLRLAYRDLDPRKARVMADISGIAQMGIEKLQLKALGGRLPMLGRLFDEMRPGLWKTVGVFLGANLEQNVQENLQNLVPVAVDALGAAIGHDMPGHDLRRDLGEWVHQMPQTFFAVLPMALVGGGVAHFRDFSDDGRFLLQPEMLAVAGFSPDQQQRIHSAHTLEEAQALYREEFPRRSPENIAAGLELLQKAREQAKQQQADPAQPKLEAIVRGERGTEWIVRDSEGRETLRTPNSETAQLALAELQQSAARRRQASMLRFSKSGDQAEIVGRMWVDLAGDERTAVLGPTPTAKDMATIVSTLSDGKEPFNIVEDLADDGSMIELRLDEKGQRYAHVSANAYNPGEIYVQSQYAGENSTLAYQAIYAWAHNNGLKVIEDPATLSNVAILRRTSQMLSSALRFGTTRHMEPGPMGGITGWREEKTQADFLNNVGVLAMREAELVVERLKEVKGLRYDGETHAFYDGEHRIPDEEVSTYFGRRIAEVDPDFSRGIGNATLRRALATVAAQGAGTLRSWRLVGQDAEASTKRIRYARNDRGEQEIPGSQETSAGGEPAEVSGGTRRPRDNGGVTREQARQWVDEVLRKWGSQLDVTVHDSAEAIPDAAMRDRVLGEGDVEGFYFGADGRVHVLADQIRSRDRVESLLKHEGFHWVVDGPLKAEYESLREWAREQIPADKLEQLRRSYPEKFVPEEYLAHLAETNPESTVWKQFVYEFRRLLRRLLGDRVEFTEEDLRAFLAKAQKRVERARSQERGDVHTVEDLREDGDDLKLSRSARALLDGDKPMPTALALQAMREAPDHPVTRALKSWFVGGFRDIQNGKAPETEAILRKFLLRLPPYESKTPLYRGVPFRNEPELRAFLKQFQGNEWVNTRPFMSTTKEVDVSHRLVKNAPYRVIVEIANGHSGRDIEIFGEIAKEYRWQREVLYLRGARFRVAIKPKMIDLRENPVYYIKLEELK